MDPLLEELEEPIDPMMILHAEMNESTEAIKRTNMLLSRVIFLLERIERNTGMNLLPG